MSVAVAEEVSRSSQRVHPATALSPSALARAPGSRPARPVAQRSSRTSSTPSDLHLTRHALDTDSPRTFIFDVRASGARFFVLTSAGPHPAIDLALSTVGGEQVPASVRGELVIQRTR